MLEYVVYTVLGATVRVSKIKGAVVGLKPTMYAEVMGSAPCHVSSGPYAAEYVAAVFKYNFKPPETPFAPTGPSGPVNPIGPVGPVAPNPVGPVWPVGPVTPTPVGPVLPVGPVQTTCANEVAIRDNVFNV